MKEKDNGYHKSDYFDGWIEGYNMALNLVEQLENNGFVDKNISNFLRDIRIMLSKEKEGE